GCRPPSWAGCRCWRPGSSASGHGWPGWPWPFPAVRPAIASTPSGWASRGGDSCRTPNRPRTASSAPCTRPGRAPSRTIWRPAPPNLTPMIKRLRRIGRYITAALTGKFNEVADPKVQLEQAIMEAQEQHRRLTEQAANVIANQKQTEMRLNRAMDELQGLNE